MADVRTTAGRSKAGLLAAFFAGCATGLAAACACIACVAGGLLPAGALPAFAAILAAAAAACFALPWKKRGEGGGGVPAGPARRRPGASPQGVHGPGPRDFNPRQAAVDELARAHSLTPREKEVLEFMAHGRDVQFISESLVLSPNTVRTHVYRVFGKVGVHGRQELIDEVERTCDAAFSNTAARPARRRGAPLQAARRTDGAAARRRSKVEVELEPVVGCRAWVAAGKRLDGEPHLVAVAQAPRARLGDGRLPELDLRLRVRPLYGYGVEPGLARSSGAPCSYSLPKEALRMRTLTSSSMMPCASRFW